MLLCAHEPQWPTQEVQNVLRWLRDHNAGGADQVRFFGVEHDFTRRLAYDARRLRRGAAPERLPALREHLDANRSSPATSSNMSSGTRTRSTTRSRTWSRPCGARSRRGRGAGRHRGSDRRPPRTTDRVVLRALRPVARRRQRVPGGAGGREREVVAGATNHRVVYWAASPHTANAPELLIVQSEGQERRSQAPGHTCWRGTARCICRSASRSPMAR